MADKQAFSGGGARGMAKRAGALRFGMWLCALLLLTAVTPAVRADNPLAGVKTFMYQLQNLDRPGAVAALAKSSYDAVVVEPTATTKGSETFDMRAMVDQLHAGKPGRLVIAYLDAGQAENFRTYWGANWKAPTRKARGYPDFLLIPDPDGWSGDFNVAYWDPRWQAVMASTIDDLMDAGFDGVYLDWIDAYDEPAVVKAAQAAHVDPAKAMVDFLAFIRETARETNPDAVVIQQNAIYLLDADDRLADVIDAVGVEDTWFSGKANAKWGSKGAGDVANRSKDDSSTTARLEQYKKYLALQKPVWTIDYCRNPRNATTVYTQAAAHGLVPLVTQVSLDRITTTPPPGH